MEMSDGTRYMYYCTNRESQQIIDHIGCRRGMPDADGNIVWEEKEIVLSLAESGRDSHHTCDPSVIAGSFAYAGEKYCYLMAYLGCTSYDNQGNKIGIAVAKLPEGPFVRVGSRPLIDFSADPEADVFQWVVGQPSLINTNQAGENSLWSYRIHNLHIAK